MKTSSKMDALNQLSNLPVDPSQSRRRFLQALGVGAAAIGLQQISCSGAKQVAQASSGKNMVDLASIPGFEKTTADPRASEGWQSISNRKIKVGLVGHGVCKFAVQFGFQDHPNVEVVAVSDLFPDRLAEMAKIARCDRTYPSLEEMLKKDKEIEAVFLATDAPSHAKHAIMALNRGVHVASAVPAVFGSLEDADKLWEAWKTSGKKYMLFETSAFHDDVHTMRELYKRDYFGKIIYAEGEYYHYFGTPLDGYNNWREGLPPQYYPTHSNGYYGCVTGQRFTEVSCLGIPSILDQFQAQNNVYKNPFGTEVANFRTSENGSARMVVSWDTPGFGAEAGRIRGEKGSYYNNQFQGLVNEVPTIKRPPLPPGVDAGGHGGSHGQLTNEFVTAIIQDRAPLVDMPLALNLSVAGIVAHHSALKGGEWMKIPQYDI
ncbi:MAG TPA: Gfo/Idh/MocA family oxidoreductase [Parapedobacter sp.]|uniref:Gfo/Idh/MocA family protein n=1 Tax=Parapedobacter sp. TaxID=1958893 RepID=UPI002C598D49|nr:Gfo/Idh/MocA family oxidoreductase [Parapedobacter sp.]HWK57098.1 Gfo/Idh/MocA family oxidoreductase [Parapedobacter sp.]